jgi:hypothetical protein
VFVPGVFTLVKYFRARARVLPERGSSLETPYEKGPWCCGLSVNFLIENQMRNISQAAFTRAIRGRKNTNFTKKFVSKAFAHIILDAFKGNKVLQNMRQNGVKRKSLTA